jgi:hypothetical protein
MHPLWRRVVSVYGLTPAQKYDNTFHREPKVERKAQGSEVALVRGNLPLNTSAAIRGRCNRMPPRIGCGVRLVGEAEEIALKHDVMQKGSHDRTLANG